MSVVAVLSVVFVVVDVVFYKDRFGTYANGGVFVNTDISDGKFAGGHQSEGSLVVVDAFAVVGSVVVVVAVVVVTAVGIPAVAAVRFISVVFGVSAIMTLLLLSTLMVVTFA